MELIWLIIPTVLATVGAGVILELWKERRRVDKNAVGTLKKWTYEVEVTTLEKRQKMDPHSAVASEAKKAIERLGNPRVTQLVASIDKRLRLDLNVKAPRRYAILRVLGSRAKSRRALVEELFGDLTLEFGLPSSFQEAAKKDLVKLRRELAKLDRR